MTTSRPSRLDSDCTAEPLTVLTATILRPFDADAIEAFVDYEDGPPTLRDLGVHDRGRRT